MSTFAISSQVDVIVLGAGFGGALAAMVALRKGCSVLLIEKGQHPRMMIGESTTPLTNLLLEEMAHDFKLPFLQDFTQWGKWKINHPTIRVGLKRGFSFYNHHHRQKKSSPPTLWDHALLVAASPNDSVADTHWWRSDWDAYLVDQCKNMGIEYIDNTEVISLAEEPIGIVLQLKTGNQIQRVKGRLLIDACGGGSGIAKILNITSKPLQHTPDTFAVYSHFNHVAPLFPTKSEEALNNAPYPPEQAAVHHMIDGGWVWSLRFDHGPVSAGAILTEESHAFRKEQSPEEIWSHILEDTPALKRLFQNAQPMYPIRKMNRVGFQMERMHGSRWIMLPSSAGFIDPLLSTGFPITLSGIQRLGTFLSPYTLREAGPIEGLNQLATASRRELAIADNMIGTLYATMDEFRHFSATTLIYFTAVSYAETARRLGKKKLAPGFLFSELPHWTDRLTECLEKVTYIHHGHHSRESKWSALKSIIHETIEHFNVIGLTPEASSPYFSAESARLLENANKLGVTSKEIQNMLIRCGLSVK